MTNSFSINDLEIATVLGSTFLLSLEEGVGERESYEVSRMTLSTYLELRALDATILDFFREQRNKVMIELNKKERAYLRDMYPRLAENKVSESDKKFLESLTKNTLNRGNYYFTILLSFILKDYPRELISGMRNSLRIGKRFSKLIKRISSGRKLDNLTEVLLKDPLPVGFPNTSITLEHLKSFLTPYGFTPSLFSSIHEILIGNFTERESNDIIPLFKNTDISNMDDLRNFPFDEFFRPNDKTLLKLAKIASGKASRVKQRLIQEDRELDIKDSKVREETHQLLQKNISQLQSLIDVKKSELQEILNETWEHITALEKVLKLHIRHVQRQKHSYGALKAAIDENSALLNISIEDLKTLLPPPPPWGIEKLVRQFWHELPYLTIIDPSSEKEIISLIRKEEKITDEKEIFSPIQHQDKRKFYPDIERVIRNYNRVFEDILEPLFIREIISQMIEIWPPTVNFDNPKSRIIATQKIHLAGLDSLPKGHFYRFSRKGKIEPTVDKEALLEREHLSTTLRKQFSTLVSVLIYDIRGSSFMSHRLRNAEKERAILTKFQSTMLDAARRGSSFILKDTGDGGILWFGANSKKLRRNIYNYLESESGTTLRYSTALPDEFKLSSHPNSAEMAIVTALHLVQTAEEFVKENYMKYRDWFEEVTEKEVFHDGITYALLPPKFKSLFRLGIGIASGQPSKDIVFTPNAFGDPDLTGILVDESALFSSGRSPERSVILVDHYTLINLLLNSDKYFLTSPLTKEDSEETILDRLLTILKWEKSGQEFIFEDFTISAIGLYYTDRKEKDKCIEFNIPDNLCLNFNDKEELMCGSDRIKILYEVSGKEKNEK